jgi:hypothetical protein
MQVISWRQANQQRQMEPQRVPLGAADATGTPLALVAVLRATNGLLAATARLLPVGSRAAVAQRRQAQASPLVVAEGVEAHKEERLGVWSAHLPVCTQEEPLAG